MPHQRSAKHVFVIIVVPVIVTIIIIICYHVLSIYYVLVFYQLFALNFKTEHPVRVGSQTSPGFVSCSATCARKVTSLSLSVLTCKTGPGTVTILQND